MYTASKAFLGKGKSSTSGYDKLTADDESDVVQRSSSQWIDDWLTDVVLVWTHTWRAPHPSMQDRGLEAAACSFPSSREQAWRGSHCGDCRAGCSLKALPRCVDTAGWLRVPPSPATG